MSQNTHKYQFDPQIDSLLRLMKTFNANHTASATATQGSIVEPSALTIQFDLQTFSSPNMTEKPVPIRFRDLTSNQALSEIGGIHQAGGDVNNDNCAICIDNFNKHETIRILKCKHQFHKECIDKWLYSKFLENEDLLCPLCQRDLSTAM